MAYKKKLSFSKIEYEDLQDIVNINEVINYTVFDDWFNFDYKLSQDEDNFLMMLLDQNILFMDSYLEEELKAQFIIPLINKVNFFCKGIRGWYERPLKGSINKVLLQGNPDYMVARGFEKPRTPYFFIQNCYKS